MVRSWAAGYVAPLWMAVALAAQAAWAGEPVLLADVNGNPEADEPRWLDTLDDRALLWTVVRAPGEAGLQRLVGVDLADGRVTTLVDGERAPRWSERVGDRLFFGTDEALWVTDGTAQGTSLAVAATAQPGAAVGDRVLFWWLLDGGAELWSTDSTPMGTGAWWPPPGRRPRATAVLGKLAFDHRLRALGDRRHHGRDWALLRRWARGGRPFASAPGLGTRSSFPPSPRVAHGQHSRGAPADWRDPPRCWRRVALSPDNRALVQRMAPRWDRRLRGRVDAIARLADRAIVVLADEVIGVSGDGGAPPSVGSSQVVVCVRR
ncbi:MAG: hypothetical protein H6706_00995 [Myxococcales bacterium]|nr:hypothetical protein [Myxococcales bacterium]